MKYTKDDLPNVVTLVPSSGKGQTNEEVRKGLESMLTLVREHVESEPERLDGAIMILIDRSADGKIVTPHIMYVNQSKVDVIGMLAICALRVLLGDDNEDE